MKKLRIMTIIAFSVAVLTVLAMVFGVFLIPIGASKESGLLIILGIAFILHGTYGMIFYWIWFARTVKRYRVAKIVETEQIYSAAEIALRLKKGRDSVNRELRYCIKKGYLKGFSFNGNYVVRSEN